MVGISLIISACAPAAPVVTPEVPEEAKEERVRMTVQAGSMGGTSILRANAIAAILMRQLGIEPTVVVYPSAIGLDTLHEGRANIVSAAYPHLIYDAYTNTGVYADKEGPWKELRVLATAADAPLQIFVMADSPFRTFRDLIGERICPGKKGVITEIAMSSAFEALGIPEEDLDLVYLAYAEGGAAMVSGKLAAYFASSAPPHPIFSEVDLTRAIRLIGFTEEDLATILEKNPTWVRVDFPATWYHMDEPCSVFSILSVMTTTTALPEDVAYELMKYWMENPTFIGYYHTSFSNPVEDGTSKYWVENANLGCPYHIGAYRYFKEIGWNIPEEMIPPEAK